ncbi:hypothetical protein L210DRAFT_3554060, partial [Boletus edulis BED1]
MHTSNDSLAPQTAHPHFKRLTHASNNAPRPRTTHACGVVPQTACPHLEHPSVPQPGDAHLNWSTHTSTGSRMPRTSQPLSPCPAFPCPTNYYFSCYIPTYCILV